MGGFCDEAQSCSSSRGGIGYFSSWMSNTNDFQNVCIFQSCQQEEKLINLANCKFILGNAILYLAYLYLVYLYLAILYLAYLYLAILCFSCLSFAGLGRDN